MNCNHIELNNKIDEVKNIMIKTCPLLCENDGEILKKGKFYRSKLALIIGENKIPVSILAAIELTHSASLFHDDVIDEEINRRGDISPNILYGNKRAVLLGDYFLSQAVRFINEREEKIIRMIYSDVLIDLTWGELVHQTIQNQGDLSFEKYKEIVVKKTGSLFGFAGFCGMFFLNQGHSPEKIVSLFNKVGMLYQFLDDCIDYLSKLEKSDEENGYITFPIFIAVKEMNLNIFLGLSQKEKEAFFNHHQILEKSYLYIRKEYESLVNELKFYHFNPELFEALNEIFKRIY